MGAMPVGMPSFKEGYDVEERFGALPDNSQGSAYDCVAEGGTEDLNMTIKVFCLSVRKDDWVFLSPRDAYSQIYIKPNGAASPRDFYKLANKVGVCEDRFLPTRPNGQPLTETFARKRDDLLPNPIYWKIRSYYSISSTNIQAITQAIFSNHGCGGAYFPTGGAMGHFIFFRGYGMHNGRMALKYRDTYEPFTKWIYLKDNNYYLQDGTAIDLAGIWTCEAGDWKPYQKKEVTTDMVRKCWQKRKDLRDAFPASLNLICYYDNSSYSIYDWARDHYDELLEAQDFSGIVKIKGTNFYFYVAPESKPVCSVQELEGKEITEIDPSEAPDYGINLLDGRHLDFVELTLIETLWNYLKLFFNWFSR